MRIRTCAVVAGLTLLIVSQVGAQQIYWKKDHVYAGPGGKEIAIITPPPSDKTVPTAPSSASYSNSSSSIRLLLSLGHKQATLESHGES